MPKKVCRFKSILLILTLIILAMVITPSIVSANGMIIGPPKDTNSWNIVQEEGQHAVINYEDGIEKLIIGIEMGGTDDEAYWIFPVPTTPKNINLDILKTFPTLTGKEVVAEAKKSIESAKISALWTQIYTTPFIIIYEFILASFGTSVDTFNSIDSEKMFVGVTGIDHTVEIHKQLVKEGITTEVISAESPRAIENYLKAKGHTNTDIKFTDPFGEYINKDYSFVVSWITDRAATNNSDTTSTRGVYVDFPTEKIYFPMILTRVYGETIVPAYILVLGHVTPDIYKEISKYTKVDYYFARYSESGFNEKFYDGQISGLEYTKIEVKSPSKYLVDDIWMENQSPLRIKVGTMLAKNKGILSIVYLVVLSVFTGLFAGMLTLPYLRKKPLKLMLIGLTNVLSLISLIFAISIVRTRNDNPEALSTVQYLKNKGYRKKRVALLLLKILIIPFSVFCLAAIPNLFAGNAVSFNLVIIIATVTFGVGIKQFSKIEAEDQNVFNQLNTLDYSSYTFLPKDDHKVVFVITYSLSFVIFAFLFAELLKSFL